MLRHASGGRQRPFATFKSRGVRDASVFEGLCREHDASIFRTIDSSPFEIASYEQSFLHTYRAVLREAHATIVAASKIQTVYQATGELGLISLAEPTRESMIAAEHMAVAYEMWLYKERFDALLLTENYNDVEHDAFQLAETVPSIAAAAVFSLDEVQVGDDVARVALNVIPSEFGGAAVLLSYLPTDADGARNRLRTVLEATRTGDYYPLSRLILEKCENVAFAPRLVDEWGEERKRVVTQFFNRTILADDDSFDDPRLNLFQ